MDKQLEGALTDILNSVLSAKDFLISEIPLVVVELLDWKFYESLIYSGFGIVLIIIMIIANYKTLPKSWEMTNDTGAPFLILNVIGSLPFIIPACHMINLSWLQIMVAPKVYLLEYVSTLTK